MLDKDFESLLLMDSCDIIDTSRPAPMSSRPHQNLDRGNILKTEKKIASTTFDVMGSTTRTERRLQLRGQGQQAHGENRRLRNNS